MVRDVATVRPGEPRGAQRGQCWWKISKHPEPSAQHGRPRGGQRPCSRAADRL